MTCRYCCERRTEKIVDVLWSRRDVLSVGVTAALSAGAARIRPASAQTDALAFSCPIGLPGRVLGDGFLVRHGYACENTWYNWYNPGWLFRQNAISGPSPKCMVTCHRGAWSVAHTRTCTRQAVNASRFSA